MSNNTNKETTKRGPQLHLKRTVNNGYDFVMFLGCSVATYVLWFNGNTTSLKAVSIVVALDAVRHAYRLVAVVK